MTASLMSEATQNYTTEQMSNALEKLGSQVSIYADKTHTNVYVSSLTKNLDATLKLVEEKLFKPAQGMDFLIACFSNISKSKVGK